VRIHAVVFDLDDTLYPEAAYVASGFRAVGDALAREHRVEGFGALAAAVAAAGVAEASVASLVPWCVARYREHLPDIALFPGGHEALEVLQGRVKLAVLTDGWLVAQRRKVEALGLAARVDAVVYSDAFGREHWKPSEVPYRAVAEALGVAHDGCVYIADNPAKDFITARALGWRTIQVARPGQTHPAEAPSAAHAAEVTAADLPAAVAIVRGWMG
jgi:putative hydrolase of the HAD superfamily